MLSDLVNDDTYTEIISSRLKDGDMVILSVEEKGKKNQTGRKGPGPRMF